MTPERLDMAAPSSRSIEFLADVAPVLGLDPEVIGANATEVSTHYQVLMSRAEQALLFIEDKGEQRLARLSALVLEAYQTGGSNLSRLLKRHNYIFDPSTLPLIVDQAAAWLCENLVQTPEVVQAADEVVVMQSLLIPTPRSVPVVERKPTRAKKAGPARPAKTVRKKQASEPIPEHPDFAEPPSTELAILETETSQNKTSAGAKALGNVDTYSGEVDSLRHYLKAIGKTPLLIAEEEVELGKSMEAGLYAQHRLGVANLEGDKFTPQQYADLKTLAGEGSKARERFILANLRLVVSIARRHQWRGLTLLDAIQEGNAGLIHAVEMFDYTKGYKFSTYASWWINQRIDRAIKNTARMIRIPVHEADNINRLRRVSSELYAQFGREPGIGELAKELDLPETKVKLLLQYKRPADSLDRSVSFDKQLTLGELVPDATIEDQEHAVLQELVGGQLKKAIHKLSLREQKVLELYSCGDETVSKTLYETLGLSRSGANMLLQQTLAKLSHPAMGLEPSLHNGRESWQADGTCRQIGPELFFSGLGESSGKKAVQKICDDCPVRDACLQYALQHAATPGIWAGTTPNDRKKLRTSA